MTGYGPIWGQPSKRPRISSTGEKLCKCQALSLAKAFNDADKYFSGNWDLVLGLRDWRDARESFKGTLVTPLHINSLMVHECEVCRFLWDARLQDDPRRRFELRAFPSYWAIPMVKASGDAVSKQDRNLQHGVLVVVPESLNGPVATHHNFSKVAIFRRQPSMSESTIQARRIDPHVDFSLVKEWITFCNTNHGRSCPKPGNAMGAKSTGVPHIPGFRLIDCETKEILSMPVSSDYVAISYVWGVVATDSEETPKWPRVVEDAAKATLALGFRYLWVDQFCIDQSDPKDKAQQVARMDVIYQQAQLTIIAAAGPDARFGLAGVDRSRPVPNSIELGDLTLTRTPGDACDSIRMSKWWTRGWTYQEGALSRRSIVFTTEQVYYECGGMVSCESFELPSNLLHMKNLKYQGKLVKPGILSGVEGGRKSVNSFRLAASTKQESQHERVQSHISNYAHRDLTHNSDMLNAFLGILAAYNVKSFFGILVPDSLASQLSPTSRKWVFLPHEAGAWELAQGLISWWHTDRGATRIPEFPSWSWAGWRGHVKARDNGIASTYGGDWPPSLEVNANPVYPTPLHKRQKPKYTAPRLPAIDLVGPSRLNLAGLTLAAQVKDDLIHLKMTDSHCYELTITLALSVAVSAKELITCWGDKKPAGEKGWEAIYMARIIQKDTGEDVWVENMSLPPIGYPPPLTTESIEKLKGLEGVTVDEIDNND
ncbi:hypothetical protein FDECE_15425 [Fusarium decemcellulare]|nr:hypothetical protein FDECE_15425 [Fusarium decemcellulare]